MRYGRYVIFQMADVAAPRELFHEILRLDGATTAKATTSDCVRVMRSRAADGRSAPNASENGQISPSILVWDAQGARQLCELRFCLATRQENQECSS